MTLKKRPLPSPLSEELEQAIALVELVTIDWTDFLPVGIAVFAWLGGFSHAMQREMRKQREEREEGGSLARERGAKTSPPTVPPEL